MADGYPELAERIDAITDVAAREEEGFRRTLESGHSLLSEAISELPGGGVLSGEVAFKLHDTFGFPVDLTKEVAAEAGLTVDLEAFDVAMDAQRKRAKEAFTGGAEAELSQMYLGVMDAVGPTEFLGYTQEESSGRILAMVREGETVDRVEAGQEAEVFVDQTPFYAEAGGQVGDRGTIETPTGIISVERHQARRPGLSRPSRQSDPGLRADRAGSQSADRLPTSREDQEVPHRNPPSPLGASRGGR